jgi:hypothetical protein
MSCQHWKYLTLGAGAEKSRQERAETLIQMRGASCLFTAAASQSFMEGLASTVGIIFFFGLGLRGAH